MTDPRQQSGGALHSQPEWCRATLTSIGDGVITTDAEGRVTFLNPVAETLTGWTQEEAAGVSMESVFEIVHRVTRRTVESPTARALRDGVTVGLANHTLLIARDGTECAIDDSASPIRNEQNEVTGVVLVFRDITERRRQEQTAQESLVHVENIIATLREPFLVLDNNLRIKSANRAFYQTFHVERGETEGRFLYDLGNGQWNILRLRTVLNEVLPDHHPVRDFDVEHDFPVIGRKAMLLNARRFESGDGRPELILLAIEDITERKRAEEALRQSHAELRSQTEELTRFNRAAVGRELDMLELKKEVNELCGRQGVAARYPLEFEQEGKGADAERLQREAAQTDSPTALLGDDIAPLESVLCTEELNRRPTRTPDYEAENRALAALVQALADSPRTILQTLADTILETLRAGSAGISLLTKDEQRFYWPAIAGAWQPHIGGGTPRDFGPCGDVLDCNAPLMFGHPERRYPYFLPVKPPVEECLLVPFQVGGKAVGTIWAIAHDEQRKFDGEDLRQLESLGRFASAAHQAVESLGGALDQRHAALGSMEDAVRSRRAVETLNAELRESEARYRTLFDSSPVAIYSIDASGLIQEFNRHATELWGRTPARGATDERFCGSFKLFLPDGTFMPRDHCPVVDVLSGKIAELLDAEVIMERPDGSRISVIANIRPIRDESGEVAGAINSFYDITDRKRAETLLSAQKEVLELAAGGAPLEDILRIVVRSAQRHSGEQSRASLFLLEPDGLHLRFVAAVGLPDAYIRAVDHFEVGPHMPSCGTVAFPGRPAIIGDVTKDPLWAPFLGLVNEHDIRAVWSQPLRTLGGKVLGTMAMYYRVPREPGPGELDAIELLSQTAALVIERNREAEQRERAEVAVRESERRFRRMIDALPAAVYTTDAEGRLTHFNPAAVECSGRIPELGTDRWSVGWKLYRPDGTPLPHAECPMAVTLKEGRVIRGEEVIVERPDGTRRWVEPYPTPLHDDEGRVVGGVNMMVDITEHKRAEELLRHNRDTFSNLIENSPFGLYIVDAEFRLRQVSNASQKIFSNVRPLIDRDFEEVLRLVWAEPFASEALGRFRHTLKTGEPYAAPNTTERRYDSADIESYDWKIQRITLPDGQFGVVCYFYDITERKQAEEALRASEERYRSLFDSIDEGFCVIEMMFDERENPIDYRFLEVNPTFEKQTGMRGATGKRMRELVPDLESHWFETYGRVALTGEPVRFVNEAKSLGGRWFDVYAFRFGGRDGRKVAVVFNDMTERRAAEEELRESQRFLRSSLDALSGHIAVLDESGRILEVNEAWHRFADENQFAGARYGIGASYLREHDPPFLPECDASAYTRGIDDVIAGRRDRFEMEYPWHSPTEQRWFVMRVTRFQSPGPTRIVIVHDDITERKLAEDASLANERRLRFVMDSMPQKIFTARPNGDIDYFNPIWMDFTGLSFEQIKDWGWNQFIHPDDLEENARLWRHSIATGEPLQFEHRFRRADGEYRWHLSRGHAMRDADGKILMWVGSNTDTHEQMEAANQLRRSAADLSAADLRKNEFLAMLAHELRNPLAPILNAVHLLRLGSDESPLQQQARAMIERQVGQLTRLVDDLLEVSRITTGRVHLRQERIVVSGIVARAAETARPLMDRHRHELTVTVPPQPVWVYADAARLEQVVVNLLTNAAKYTDDGGRVWLSVEREGDEAVMRVRDTGVGIGPELLPRVFELFTQAERSLDRAQGGLGIGLALVQRLVELHGGRVEAYSVLGQGSEFVVRLPVVPTLAPQPPSAPATTTEANESSLRILVVDDNVDSAESLAMLLEMSRHQVRTAHDGPAALVAALDFRPNVVLLDIGLPIMDGYEVARRMRGQPTLGTVLLIAMTGYGQESDRQLSREAGFDHHLVKPVDFGKLQQILATVSEKAK